MLTRRIAASACALTLGLPALAVASPIHEPVTAQRTPVAYGGPSVANSGGVTYADRVGSLTPEQLAAAYGTTKPVGTPIPATTTAASDNNGTDGWEIAALGGAALLAACGLGGAFIVRARRRTAVGA
jgi:hypothetical protein